MLAWIPHLAGWPRIFGIYGVPKKVKKKQGYPSRLDSNTKICKGWKMLELPPPAIWNPAKSVKLRNIVAKTYQSADGEIHQHNKGQTMNYSKDDTMQGNLKCLNCEIIFAEDKLSRKYHYSQIKGDMDPILSKLM